MIAFKVTHFAKLPRFEFIFKFILKWFSSDIFLYRTVPERLIGFSKFWLFLPCSRFTTNQAKTFIISNKIITDFFNNNFFNSPNGSYLRRYRYYQEWITCEFQWLLNLFYLKLSPDWLAKSLKALKKDGSLYVSMSAGIILFF